MIKITDGAAELKQVKTKKKSATKEDPAALYLVMTFLCLTKAEKVTPDILGGIAQVFWRDDPDKNPLLMGIKSVTSASKVEHATLQFAGVIFDKCVQLQKWEFTPRAHGMIDLKFDAIVKEPTRDQRLGMLAKMIKPGLLEVEGELDLLEQMESGE